MYSLRAAAITGRLAFAIVVLGTSPVAPTVATVNGVKYAVFDVVPNQGTLHLTKANVVTSTAGATTDPAPKIWPNPFANRIMLEAKGNFIYSLDGKLLQTGQGQNTVNLAPTLASGLCVVKISQNSQVISSKMIKW